MSQSEEQTQKNQNVNEKIIKGMLLDFFIDAIQEGFTKKTQLGHVRKFVDDWTKQKFQLPS